MTAGDAETNADEVMRLRSEVTALRGQLDDRRRRVDAVKGARRAVAALLVMLAAFCGVASMVGVWAANTVLNTDRWVATVAPLPRDPQVAAAVAEYTTTEVFQLLDVEQRLREALPDRAAFVAVPITGQVRDYLRKEIDARIRSDRFQKLWVEINRRAQPRAVAILQGRNDVVQAYGNRVTIDLLPIINQLLHEFEAQLPTMFGRKLNLPDISSGQIPPNLRATVENAVGVPIPANFAQFTFYDGGRMRLLQRMVVGFSRGFVALVTTTFVLLGLALWTSPRRRRTLLQLGLWLVIAVTVVTASLRAVRAQVVAGVPPGSYRDGVAAVMTTVFATLRERGQQLLLIGLLLAVVAYLAGPGRVPRWLRRHVASAGRTTGGSVRRGAALAVRQGPGWVSRRLDALRIAGIVAAVLAALLLSSWIGLLVVAAVLVAYELAVTVVAR